MYLCLMEYGLKKRTRRKRRDVQHLERFLLETTLHSHMMAVIVRGVSEFGRLPEEYKMNELPQLGEADKKYWGPQQSVIDWLLFRISDGDKVLEIGPGMVPFPRADMFVDWIDSGSVPKEKFIQCDIQNDPLPFTGDEFDFVYCRHVLEDLYDPIHLCREMSRVAKAGYIETPSPMAEMCRGIDGNSPNWRGYQHHRYFVWSEQGTLHFLAKYPIVEYIKLDPLESKNLQILRENGLHWNTYFTWENEISFRFFQHEVDFNITKNYHTVIAAALEQGMINAHDFASKVKGLET